MVGVENGTYSSQWLQNFSFVSHHHNQHTKHQAAQMELFIPEHFMEIDVAFAVTERGYEWTLNEIYNMADYKSQRERMNVKRCESKHWRSGGTFFRERVWFILTIQLKLNFRSKRISSPLIQKDEEVYNMRNGSSSKFFLDPHIEFSFVPETERSHIIPISHIDFISYPIFS